MPNPDNIPGGVTSGYQRQNTLLYASMVGFLNIHMSNDGIISVGTVFEFNGVMIKVDEPELVQGIDLLQLNSVFFVYAVPVSLTEVSFVANGTIPTWDTTKCGWYDSNGNRALLRCVTNSNRNISGVMKMTDVLQANVPPNTGGELLRTWNTRTHESYWLDMGWYRYEMASGLGRGNGMPMLAGNVPGGGVASGPANIISGVFFHSGGSIIAHVGGNGYAGGNGGMPSTGGRFGGGGGSGAGEKSYIISGTQRFSTGNTPPGRGADGGNGAYNNSGGKGGGTNAIGHDSSPSGQGGGITKTANPSAGGSGGTHVANGENGGMPMKGFGGGGGGGAGGSQSPGGQGGSGGSPGWFRPLGDTAAGYANIYRL